MPQYLVSLLYGELQPDEEEKVKKHIESCTSCRNVYQELESTTGILERWEDEKPKLSLVFVNEPVSRWKAWIEKLNSLSWAHRFALGVPAFAALVLVFLSVLNFRMNVRDGEWHVAVGLIPTQPPSNQEQIVAAALDQQQKETLMLISKLIEDSEYRQRRETALTLAQFAQDLERQRQQDLKVVGQSLVGIQRSTEGRFQQTSSVLSDLIRLTSYKLERK